MRSIDSPMPPTEPVSPLKVHNVPLKPKNPIKRRSDKRVDQEKEYKRICDKMDERPGKKMCFFCGMEIKGKTWHHHHLDGREGDKLIIPGLIVLAHPKCHSLYHDVSFAKLPWRWSYLNRLCMVDSQLYEREKMKLDK